MNCEEVKKLLLENGEAKIKAFNEKLIPGSGLIFMFSRILSTTRS